MLCNYYDEQNKPIFINLCLKIVFNLLPTLSEIYNKHVQIK